MSPEFEDPARDAPTGVYANYFRVGHNAFEFLIDFGQSFADDAEPRFHTRIVTSPAHAKNLVETLQTSLDQYERAFGHITVEQE